MAGGTANWLPLHELSADEAHGGPAQQAEPRDPGARAQPYYIGLFLVGAYQEILGDAHNQLGRVAEVHVYASRDEPDNFWIEETLPGISVREMLADVQYFPNDLDRRMSDLIKTRIDAGVVKPAEGMRILNQYTRFFDRTTYCELP